MSQSLADDLPGGPVGSLRVWLKSSGYARRLLLGPEGDPWAEGTAKFLSFFTQARGLLPADVAVIEVGDLVRSWTARHPALAAAMGTKPRATWPLRRMLDEAGPRHLLDEAAEAVGASLRGQVPLVLAMPSPAAWLAEAQRLAGRDPAPAEADDVEDAAMYVADFIRCAAARPVGGLLLEEAGAPGPADRYRPVLNAARHYRWAVVGRGAAGNGTGLFDAVIGAEGQGCDVTAPLFAGEALPPLAQGGFRFAEIPEDHPPEAVLDALARLRA